MKKISEKTLLIGAGKGGVGKSTVAVNLSIALASQGLKVGLLDADLYGPSIPIMLGLRNIPPQKKEKWILPFEKFGIHTLSIGAFLEEERSILWRGPMLHTMLQKLLYEVAWPHLDILLIDLPPGTGDVPLSLKKLTPVAGALMVTTPQEVALMDVRKAIHAFKQLEIPIAGLVENFSSYTVLDQTFYPFGSNRGVALAGELQIPCLATLPLLDAIRIGGDSGLPFAYHQPEPGPFHELASKLLSQSYG